MYNVSEAEQYIRQAAAQRGINPDIAVRVAKSEGLAQGVWQSNLGKNGRREPSYGPFQLLVGGGGSGYPEGLGNRFLQATGKHPSDPSTLTAQVDFALDQARTGGWTPWYGAKAAGIDRWAGINGQAPSPYASMADGPKGQETFPSPETTGSVSPFGSLGPTISGSLPDYVLSGLPGQNKKKDDPIDDAAALFSAASKRYQPPRIDGAGGDARQMGDLLLKIMQNPQALTQALMSRRVV